MEKNGISFQFCPEILASKNTLFPLTDVVAVSDYFYKFSFGGVRITYRNTLLWKGFGLIFFKFLIKKHNDLICGIID